ncbi:radical SAM protein [Archaeoglobus veneficus]|uniref:Radical SAM domain protein n=1 Tax=Archaeoglobus veneficus (strain DSM 11195 / SNP6) TaxID=693661 RepID=F2KN67_ARCVS|nr:radical SAM protein [Archaeoglobus veneficus]AEA46168.1 Radical SAM domain protein [Archaeoglobus veneficus SNP6]
MKRIEAGSYYRYLSEGCKLCRRGAKLVLFVTGECPHSCFYCPISEERRGKDVIFANEREVRSADDVIAEIELMDAMGASITGGEPLIKLEKVLEFAKLFKSFDLHVHIYTSIPAKPHVVEKLAEYIDEIRFHPINLEGVERFREPIVYAKKLGMDAGIEIPALRFSEELARLVNECDAFMNLNELEFSSTNFDELIARGYEPGEFYGDVKSGEIARMYAEVVEKFHYCTALFKDKAQLRRRLIRMAFNHPDFYRVTNDGTLLCGFIEGDIEVAKKILDAEGVEYVVVEGGVETSIEFVEERSEDLKAAGLKVSIIERYPTSKRIVVESIPL